MTRLTALDAPASPSVAALLEATKPGITRMVVITSGVGFALAALHRQVPVSGATTLGVIAALVGTALTASGANALNQCMEWRRDARMPRTASRPIPSHRLTCTQTASFALALCVLGLAVLGVLGSLVPALIALLTILSYVLIYTPLKPLTPWSTVIGAVPGALPPLIGWTAAQPDAPFAALAQAGGWSIVAIIFVWQLPHFLAIAWKYREQYHAAGLRVLPAVDPTGRRTSRAILLWTALLLPVSLAPALALPGLVSPLYLATACVAGICFALPAVRLARTHATADAVRTFIASVLYLPVVLLVLVADALRLTLF